MKKKRIFIAAVCFALISTATVWAEGNLQSIQVIFDRINLTINGQQADLNKDSILYNGSVYVPLRSLSEMLGAEVSWNKDTQSVNLDFIANHNELLQSASQKGIYQYISLLNNAVMADLFQALKTTDTQSMKNVRDQYAMLSDLAKKINDDELSRTFSKLEAAVELLRGGWETKNFDDYSIAWNIYNTNAEKVNTILKANLSNNGAK